MKTRILLISLLYVCLINGIPRGKRAPNHFDFGDDVAQYRRTTNAVVKGTSGESRPKRVTVVQPIDSFSNNPECGEPKFLATRIVGGNEAPKGAYPWMAALTYFDLSNVTLVGCGGSIITKRIILTAAHCLRTRNPQVLAMPDEIIVGVSKLASADRIQMNTLAGVSHKKYNKNTQQNDIAMIIMDDPIIFNDLVLPICLPTPELRKANLDNKSVRTAGWGSTRSAGLQSNVLLEITIKVTPQAECKNDYKGFKNVFIDDSVICAVDKVKKLDSCQGDSGGPLMYSFDGKYYVIGIVSTGDVFCGSSRPGIYTNVMFYMDWITKKIQEINSNFPDD